MSTFQHSQSLRREWRPWSSSASPKWWSPSSQPLKCAKPKTLWIWSSVHYICVMINDQQQHQHHDQLCGLNHDDHLRNQVSLNNMPTQSSKRQWGRSSGKPELPELVPVFIILEGVYFIIKYLFVNIIVETIIIAVSLQPFWCWYGEQRCCPNGWGVGLQQHNSGYMLTMMLYNDDGDGDDKVHEDRSSASV